MLTKITIRKSRVTNYGKSDRKLMNFVNQSDHVTSSWENIECCQGDVIMTRCCIATCLTTMLAQEKFYNDTSVHVSLIALFL